MVDPKGDASAGFPGDCPTNAYLLEGFGHVVYMVSTLASGGTVNEAATISRLKNAEKELRSQSLLVSLDIETNELFTFHRFNDFKEDGRTIYGRLATVLRHNQCIISFKCALRATDLLKDEHARLRAFLLSAVFLALKPSLVDNSNSIPLGTRTFLRPQAPNDAQTWYMPENERQTIYQINMINLQLLSNGQLLITSISRKPEYFQAVAEVLKQMANHQGTPSLDPGILCLVPTGQMARYTGGQLILGSFESSQTSRPVTAQSDQQARHVHDARFQVWKEQLSMWLVDQGLSYSSLTEDYWLEVEIPLSQKREKEEVDAPEANEITLVWKRLFWPAQHCFYLQKDAAQPLAEAKIPEEDPVGFVQDWLLKSEERATEISGRTVSRPTGYENEQFHNMVDNMEEDVGFDSTPQMHNTFSAVLPPSQMMYPTPPDNPFTQATPGMSSVDGIGMTPADTTRPNPAEADHLHDIDMLDQINASGVGTGTYDEDLFEDLPTDRFGIVGAADEPDWDFFEQHTANFGEHSQQIDKGEVLRQDAMNEGEILPENTTAFKSDRDDSEKSTLPPQALEKASAYTHMSPLEQAPDDSVAAEPTSSMSVSAVGELQGTEAVEVPVNYPVSRRVERHLESEQDLPVEIWKKPPIPPSRGRRRSLYNSSEDLTAADNNDERYTANGTFWFDAAPTTSSGNEDETGNITKNPNSQGFLHGVPSPHESFEGSNESETSSFYEVSEMDVDEDGSTAKRKWTQYEQAPVTVDLGPTAEELKIVEADIQKLLKLLRPVTLDDTWILDNKYGTLSPLSTPSIKPEHSAMVAQVLVDQYTQTSVIQDAWLRLQTVTADRSHMTISGPVEGPYGRLEPSTLSSLTKAIDGAAQTDTTNRLSTLERHQLCVLRGEKALLVSSPALSLWETLNLQPKGGRKDVQAFCLHPDTACLETGCGVFLERMGEVYVSCNLGDHTVGQLAGISNEGLVSWSDHGETSLTLQQSCERLGTALARLPPASNNVVIYMLHVPGSAVSPVSLVEAFCTLFEAYGRACNKQNPIELALQIVPLGFVASPDALIIRTPQEYTSLAIEVYNRFPPSQLGEKLATCGSAVVLDDSPRRRIRFDMVGHSGSASTIGGQCLHLSYSYSDNNRWIVAAWTDERGFRALTMCYCLQNAGKSPRPRSDIVQDMWELSQELIGKEQRNWRLIISRAGYYEPSEVNEWVAQYNSNRDTTKCAFSLLSVDLDPVLSPQIPGLQSKVIQGTTPQQPLNNYGTPVSTPQGNTTSPDQYLTATPTPSGSMLVNAPTSPEVAFDPNHEGGLTVQESTEESWAVVLPFGLNQSRTVLQNQPAMLSGYLLKRRGVCDEDGLCQLGVSLIHTSTSPSPAAREELLKDVLGQYRGLVALARTRGCIHPVQEVVPWHVATSIKGARALNRWM